MAAISSEISDKIEELSRSKKWDELVTFLKEKMESDEVKVQDIFEYAEQSVWDKTETFVIDAATINRIGVVVKNLQDEGQAKLAPEFYKLAADCNYDRGCLNYAICLRDGRYGIKKSPQKALVYAKKAVKLNRMNTHQLILYDCLRENHKNVDANEVLSNFLNQLNELLCDLASKKGKVTQEKAFELCNQTIEKIGKIYNSINAELKTCLDFLTKFVNVVDFPRFETLKQKAYFIKGKIHESLDEYPWTDAMRSYCMVTDENPEIFNEAIAARAELLKKQACILLGIKSSESEKSHEKSEEPADGQVTREEKINSSESEEFDRKSEESVVQENTEKKQDKYLFLPHDVQLPTDFRKFWTKETKWFYSVEEECLDKEFETRKIQLEQLMKAKKLELKLNADLIEEELKNFMLEKDKLSKKLSSRKTNFSPEDRRSIRAHKAESRFFDFNRSEKKKQILELTCKIIEQRVRAPKSISEPIYLTGISTRVLITAEKLFQSVMLIPGNFLSFERCVNLSIPIGRKTFWNFGYSSGTNCYAPSECYNIGKTKVTCEHRTNPKAQRVGDSYIDDINSYKSIYRFLFQDITNKGDSEKTKKIAEWMIRYGKEQQPVTLEELQEMHSELEKKQLLGYIDSFNRICFLVMAKEQVQWLSATAPRYQLGMAVAQARCLIMMKAGFITLKEAFSSSALFGVYTGGGLADDSSQLANPCKAINDLYLAYLQSQNRSDYMNFFKKYISKERGQAQKPRTWVLTREQAHQDLRAVYGGDSDTDGDEYHSDLSDSEEGSDLDVQAPMGKLSM